MYTETALGLQGIVLAGCEKPLIFVIHCNGRDLSCVRQKRKRGSSRGLRAQRSSKKCLKAFKSNAFSKVRHEEQRVSGSQLIRR